MITFLVGNPGYLDRKFRYPQVAIIFPVISFWSEMNLTQCMDTVRDDHLFRQVAFATLCYHYFGNRLWDLLHAA